MCIVYHRIHLINSNRILKKYEKKKKRFMQILLSFGRKAQKKSPLHPLPSVNGPFSNSFLFLLLLLLRFFLLFEYVSFKTIFALSWTKKKYAKKCMRWIKKIPLYQSVEWNKNKKKSKKMITDFAKLIYHHLLLLYIFLVVHSFGFRH